MITSRLVRPIVSTSAAFASLIRPVNTPHFAGSTFGLNSGAVHQQLVKKMHIQSIPMCMFLGHDALSQGK
jgi:hypothetical protein